MRRLGVVLVGLITFVLTARGAEIDPQAAERGREAFLCRWYAKPAWSLDAYKKARDFWDERDAVDPDRDPAGYAAAFEQRYGLHPAPFPNDGLPMGLRRVSGAGGRTGLTLDCLVCHGGSIGGTSYVGLGNSQLDLKALLDDLTRADGKVPPPALFTLNSARGTNNASQIAVTLLSMRNPDLSFRKVPLLTGTWLPELDTPPWWQLHRKRTRYYDGRTDVRATRSNMQFFLGDFTLAEFQALEPTFQDIDAFLFSLRPPRYPFPIDADAADRGQAVFEANCARCHGTYGPDGHYPNKIVPLAVVGTDPARLNGISDRIVAHYNATWFGQKDPVKAPKVGYQAPPLDGIWASAPYLHNGSVPTLQLLLKSSDRPARFRRPPSTDFAYYDTANVGWRFEAVADPPPQNLSPYESKFLFDASRFGLGNQGHTFGDPLSDEDRRDLIEYLKTL